MRTGLRRAAAGLVLCALLVWAADRAFPPDLSRLSHVSVEVTDRDGVVLQTYLTPDGYLRLPGSVARTDPRLVAVLTAYEDKRFGSHWGVDPVAVIRAGLSALKAGRIVSGASTLTMQTARLLEPRPRTLGAKLIEMARAVQLEWRFTKDEILSIYLTLAPYGGNREGVEAAARSYFGHGADRLSLAEAALLVALPQSPESLRPDRYPGRARSARNHVLARTAARIGLGPDRLSALQAERLALQPAGLAADAPHLGARLVRAHPGETRIVSALEARLQQKLRALLKARAQGLGPRTGLAALVIDNDAHAVRAYVGAPDPFDAPRHGAIDMVRAVRSPGSTLKPFIYGLAMDEGLVHPFTLINDAPTQFGDYAPANFQDRHYGEVPMAEALRRSLNVPAVAVLDRLGPVRFAARLERAGIHLRFNDPAARPGLAVALGGVGLTLEDLARAYAALAGDGIVRPLTLALTPSDDPGPARAPVLSAWARWHVGEILRGARPPSSLLDDRYRKAQRHIAFKTGTSYGFRDAWAIGFTPAYTVAVWAGRPDGTPSPGRFGANTAAPVLFDIFDLLPRGAAPRRPASVAALVPARALPPGLQTLDGAAPGIALGPHAPPPRITFPRTAQELVMPEAGAPLVLEAEGGEGPLTWLVNGHPQPTDPHSGRARWTPDGPGFVELAVVDGLGRRAGMSLRLVALDTVLGLD